MKHIKILSIAFVLLMVLPLISASAKKSTTPSDTGAELSILPIGQIPLITPNSKAGTTIPLHYTDNFGMNWTKLQYFYGNTGFRALLSFFVTRVFWPIIHPTWKPFLGYSSVNFNVEIMGNQEGWAASVNPKTIPQSTDGTTADLTLTIFLNSYTAENTAIIRISATRILKDGSVYGTSYFEIPIKTGMLNYLDIVPVENVKEIAPGSQTTFQIDFTNKGYFMDAFSVQIISDSSVIATLSEQSIVLQPKETRRVSLFVMTKDNVFDPGTPHILTIKAVSLNVPGQEFTAQVQVKTKGYYFSELSIFSIGLVLFVIFVFLFILYSIFKRKIMQTGKPDKPWNIPEERRYLDELKKTDKAEYERVLKMMNEEYQSAMFWYEDYVASMKRERKSSPKEKKRIFSRLFKKSKPQEPDETPQQQKPFKQSKEAQKPTSVEPTEQIPEMIPVEEKPVDQQPLAEADEKKLKTLLKIRRAQEKQRKRLLKK